MREGIYSQILSTKIYRNTKKYTHVKKIRRNHFLLEKGSSLFLILVLSI